MDTSKHFPRWNPDSSKLTKVMPNDETATALFDMSKLILKRIKATDEKSFTSLVVEDYYEAIKELITALLILEGYKTTSHEILIAYLINYKEIEPDEIMVLDQLRKIRNDINYRGTGVNYSYLEDNKCYFELIIHKLKQIIKEKLGS